MSGAAPAMVEPAKALNPHRTNRRAQVEGDRERLSFLLDRP